jgi:hypothetical protein
MDRKRKRKSFSVVEKSNAFYKLLKNQNNFAKTSSDFVKLQFIDHGYSWCSREDVLKRLKKSFEIDVLFIQGDLTSQIQPMFLLTNL